MTETDNSFQEFNRAYYNKYGKHYEEYQAYFRNTFLLSKWRKNLEICRLLLNKSNDLIAVDFGSGTGILTIMLLELGFSVISIDVSEIMLDILQEKLKHLSVDYSNKVRLIHGGIETIGELEKTSVGLIAESSVLHHMKDYVSFIKQSYSALKAGGILYIGREPLVVQEQKRNKFNIPLNLIFPTLDRLILAKENKNRFREVFDKKILPSYDFGGISNKKIIETALDLEMKIIFNNFYNWHRSKHAFFLNNLLPRFLRYEDFWCTFFDVALQKKMTTN